MPIAATIIRYETHAGTRWGVCVYDGTDRRMTGGFLTFGIASMYVRLAMQGMVSR